MAEGRYASVEEAVRLAVDQLVASDFALGDLDWVKPLLDEARASIAREEGIPSSTVFAETDAWLKKRGA